MPDIIDAGKTIFGLFAILLIGTFIIGSFAGVLPNFLNPEGSFEASPDPVTGEFVTFEPEPGNVTRVASVRDSKGNAVELTGADDSYVQSKDTITFADDDTWTACTWAEVDSDAGSKTMTALSLNGRVLIQYNGTVSNWSAWYYDDGSTNSYRVDINATNQPGNLAHVCAWHNGSTLAIYRGNTLGETQDTTAASIEDAYLNGTNWDGTLEESRVFDDALNDSQRQQLVDSPVTPLKASNRTARLMYDEGSGSTTAIFFTSASATLSNHTWVSGHPGNSLSGGLLGSDYELSDDKKAIKALAGGKIDGAPVVFISYDFEPLDEYGQAENEVSGGYKNMVDTFTTVALIMVAGLMLFFARRFD